MLVTTAPVCVGKDEGSGGGRAQALHLAHSVCSLRADSLVFANQHATPFLRRAWLSRGFVSVLARGL